MQKAQGGKKIARSPEILLRRDGSNEWLLELDIDGHTRYLVDAATGKSTWPPWDLVGIMLQLAQGKALPAGSILASTKPEGTWEAAQEIRRTLLGSELGQRIEKNQKIY